MSSDRVLPPPYSLGQCLGRLPLYAQQKYEQVTALLADSEALQRSLLERIKLAEERLARIARQRSYANGRDLDGELAAARSALDRLDKERSRRNSVRANVEQTVSRLNNFITARMSGAARIAAPPPLTSLPAGQRAGESIADALVRTRREISAAQAELRRIQTAPPPADEVKIAIIESVDALVREGRPVVTSEGGRVTVHWPDVVQYAAPGAALSAPSGSASRLLAWLLREP